MTQMWKTIANWFKTLSNQQIILNHSLTLQGSFQIRTYSNSFSAAVLEMVWTGILGNPDDWDGGNWVWLKEGNPGV